MKLNYQEALSLCKRKIFFSFTFGSSCSLLWHNHIMYEFGIENNYHPILFEEIKKYLFQLINQTQTTN